LYPRIDCSSGLQAPTKEALRYLYPIRKTVFWGEPVLIVSRFAGEPTLDKEGNLYFAHHFYWEGVMLDADIFIAKKKYKGPEPVKGSGPFS